LWISLTTKVKASDFVRELSLYMNQDESQSLQKGGILWLGI
jgi:hypothetical protein